MRVDRQFPISLLVTFVSGAASFGCDASFLHDVRQPLPPSVEIGCPVESPSALSAEVERRGIRLRWAYGTESLFIVERASANSGFARVDSNDGPGPMVLFDPTVELDTSYRYRVRAQAVDCLASSELEVVSWLRPPDGVAGEASTPTSVHLSWTDTNAFEAAYVVTREDGPPQVVTSTSFVDEDLSFTSNRAVVYRVAAQHPDGHRVQAPPIEVWTLPPSPSGVTVVPRSDSTLEVQWQHAEPWSGSVRIWREQVSVGVLPASNGSYLDTDLGHDERWRYSVATVGRGGMSAPVTAEARTFRRPDLSWRGRPHLDRSCRATFEADVGLDWRASSYTSTAGWTMTGTISASPSGPLGVVGSVSAGPHQLVWTVTDDLGSRSTLRRSLAAGIGPDLLRSEPSDRSGLTRPLGGGGRQRLYDSLSDDCLSCAGPAGSVAGGTLHACVLLADRTVDCWGQGSNGQLGTGTSSDALRPVPVCEVGNFPNCISRLEDVEALAAGALHTCARLTSGELRCWGANDDGELGNGGTDDVARPVVVCAPGTAGGPGCVPMSNVRSVSAGRGKFTCAVREAASHYDLSCWGNNILGTLGDGTTNDRSIPALVCVSGSAAAGNCVPMSSAIAVSAGHTSACALLDTSEAVCWGNNSFGQVGNGERGDFESPVVHPSRVCASGSGSSCVPLVDLIEVHAGGLHACAIDDLGAVWCWGNDEHGQLGDGDRTSGVAVHPVRVCTNGSGACVPLPPAVGLALAFEHSCALLATGEVYCWGRNTNGFEADGRLGAGEPIQARAHAGPVCRTGSVSEGNCVAVNDAIAISSTTQSACALVHDFGATEGRVECWGAGGLIGNGNGPIAAHNPVNVCRSGSGPTCTLGAPLDDAGLRVCHAVEIGDR